MKDYILTEFIIGSKAIFLAKLRMAAFMKVALVGSFTLSTAYAEEMLTPEAAQRVLSDALIENREYFEYLIHAIESNNPDVVELLLQAGVDVNLQNQEGLTPLMYAAKLAKRECLVSLIEHAKTQWDARNTAGQTAYDVAVAAGRIDCAQFIAAQMKRVAGERLNARGITPGRYEAELLNCAARGIEDVLKLLLIVGVDVNAVDVQQETALIKAAAGGNAGCLKMLLDAEGIDVTPVGKERWKTPLAAAVAFGHTECVKLLLADSRIDVNQPVSDVAKTALHIAVSNGNLEMMQLLLAKEGIITTCRTRDGKTILHAAVECETGNCLRAVLECAPVLNNIQDAAGNTPLHIAIERDDENVVDALLNSPDIKTGVFNNNGDSPLLLALRNGNHTIVGKLLARPDVVVGKKVLAAIMQEKNHQVYEQVVAYMMANAPKVLPEMEIFPSQYDSMLFKSLKTRNHLLFDLLLRAGADCNAKDDEGTPLLCMAVALDTSLYTRSLLAMPEIDVFKTDMGKRSPLHVATEARQLENLKLLLLHSPGKTTMRDAQGNTPLHVAVGREFMAGVEALLQDSSAPVFVKNEAGAMPRQIAMGLRDKRYAELIMACEKKAAKGFLLQMGIDEPAYDSALMTYVSRGALKMVELLLFAGADVNKTDQAGNAPIHVAAKLEQPDVLKLLLASPGCKADAVNHDKQSALHLAALADSPACVQYLLSNCSSLLKQEDARGCIPYDVAHDASPSFKLLLEAHVEDIRAELLTRDIDEPALDYALCAAAFCGNARTVSICLRAGANVNGLVQNRTALDYAIEKGHARIVRQLLKVPGIDINLFSRDMTPLHAVVREGMVSILGDLLECADIKVNLQEQGFNRTALHLAVEEESEEMIAMLLAHKDIEVTLTDAAGNTPLALAVEDGYEEGVQALLKSSKACLTMKNKEGAAPIHIAIRHEMTGCVKKFISRDANQVNYRDSEGRSPVYIATKYGRVSVLRTLLSYRNLDVDMAAYNGMTALHVAALNKNATCLEILMRERTCNVNARDKANRTPLYIAAEKGSLACVQMLLPYSQDLMYPLVAANQNGHEACVRVIAECSNARNKKK